MRVLVRPYSLFCAAAALTLAWPAPAQEREVKVTTDFSFNGRHAYFFVAIEKGHFKQENLRVQMLPGRGSGTTVQEVAAGITKIGFADAGVMVIARAAEKTPVKLVAAVYDSPHSLIYMEDSGIKSPKDLEGKTISDAATSPMFQFFPEYAKRAGIDASKVKLIAVNSAATTSMLLTGKTDAIGQMSVGVPLLELTAAPRKVKVLYYRDAGLNMYSSGIIASDETIAKEPDLVRAFIRALQRGMKDAFDNPDEAGRIMAKSQQQIAPAIATAETKLVGEMVATAIGREKGFGYIDPEKMRQTVELVAAITPKMNKIDYQETFAPGFVLPMK